jgi:hypothetical protein
MKASKILILSILYIVIGSKVSAQDISRYLDDGGLTNKRNLIKLGFDPVNNEFPLIYERGLGKHFGAELGGGLVSLQRQYHMYSGNPYTVESSGLGYNAWMRIKIYPDFFPERKYFAIQTRVNNLSEKWFTDIVTNIGYQRVVAGNWVMDFNLGLGVRLFTLHDLASKYFDDDRGRKFIVILTIETGYFF